MLHTRLAFPLTSRLNLQSFSTSKTLIEKEKSFSAKNYSPLPIVFSKAKGVEVWDPEGKRYFDFLSAYSAVNQGHCHPRILKTLQEQAEHCTLSSRAFYNDQWPRFAEYVCQYFGYERVVPMNTGAEAVETAIKIARRWAYQTKKIPHNEALIVSCCGCFHGRTIGNISFSCDDSAMQDFGPFVPGHLKVDYDDYEALEKLFNMYGKRIAGFLVEPIQGEAGVVVPREGYLKKCYDLCQKHNVLFLADEIQSGIARSGKLLAIDYDGVKPDLLILGKALSGGAYPVSAVLSSEAVMSCLVPGSHGSTYGGNPLGSAIAITALQIVKDENLVERSFQLGEIFRKELLNLNNPLIEIVRGRGLFNGVVINDTISDKNATDLCLLLKSRGLLAKPTHDRIIRFTPPLVISDKQMEEALDIIKTSFRDLLTMDREKIPGVYPKKPKSATYCPRCGRETE